jgi:phage portal protein BeeE
VRPIERLARRKFNFVTDNPAENPYAASLLSFAYGGTTGERESIDSSFDSYVRSAYKSNGIVFACILARMLPFSEARFQLQELVGGRPGKLIDNSSLRLLEEPWANGTTGELLSRMEQDASLAGNFYATVVDGRIRRLRPDWVTIISGVHDDKSLSPFDLKAEVLGYVYQPTGVAGKSDAVLLSPENVVHYSPIPDPDAQWRGMSWLTPLIREVKADTYATKHKLGYFENGASLSLAIKYDASYDADQVSRFAEMFNEAHQGSDKAYKVLHIGGGADPVALGTELKNDFRSIQGAGETRIAAAAGVGAIIARFSEGLAGSALNQGNYAAAKRQFADMTLRPLWRTAAASLSKLVAVPAGTRLWYDIRDVEFLKEDRKDAAEIMQITAATMNTLVTAGYTPESVIVAVETGDMTRLEHSGRYSVQLHSADTGGATQVVAP